ncbi:MAG: ATP-dependent helicase, partial [Candidatus Sumerlaeaceae bacterium]|nr:ATP-dependent helicase [Candidatus Sumerlaeaceae bacterium]
VLPGEVIYRCVDAMQQGAIEASQLPIIEHLIVDEFQDLNACDQEFVRLLASHGAVLFVAGDDDQSIYSFRHADPKGIVQFPSDYKSSSTRILTDCFRCTPNILAAATRLIAYNSNRVPKNLISLYANASPPVQGKLLVWSFQMAQEEARAVAGSCQALIKAGMAGREDEILILISNRRVQLDIIEQELRNLGLPYDLPRGSNLVNELEPLRAVYAILRIVRDQVKGEQDYPAHRDILGILDGIGCATANAVADACIAHNQNFRQLFYLDACPTWLTGRQASAVQRVQSIVKAVGNWNMSDTLAVRTADIARTLSDHVFTSRKNATNHVTEWINHASGLPAQMSLEEYLQYLAADTESDQQTIVDLVIQRTGEMAALAPTPVQKRIRILTMHGAKGLSGKVVFIPSAEQGIMPNFKALQATGLLIEQRRLFYVSVTRAMACCIISHAVKHTGAQARALTQKPVAQLTRSQFLNEMECPSASRTSGLTDDEAADIVAEVTNL